MSNLKDQLKHFAGLAAAAQVKELYERELPIDQRDAEMKRIVDELTANMNAIDSIKE